MYTKIRNAIKLGLALSIAGIPAARADWWCTTVCTVTYYFEMDQCATAYDALLVSCGFQAVSGAGATALQECIGEASDFQTECGSITAEAREECNEECMND